jgi:hypothetical protein
MPTTPKWQGSAAIQEDPNSPQWTNDQNGQQCQRIFGGRYASLLATQPLRGASMAGFAGVFVDSVVVKNGPGNKGNMTVILKPSITPGIDSDQPTEEMEWSEIQKKLELHPRYQATGAKPLTDPDLDKIEEWKSETTSDGRNKAYLKLSANAKEFVTKLRRGEDSFIVFAPVARATYKSKAQPVSTNCGFISSPPPDLTIEGYTYLKTADRMIRQSGNWEHVLEWTGGTNIDTDIYSNDPGT